MRLVCDVMVAFGVINYTVLAVYLAAMLIIGIAVAGRQKTTEDYFLAGRKMPWLVVGMSMFASLTSASTYMGVPVIAYKENIAIFFGVLISPIAAPLIILLFYPFYRRLNVTTSYEYILKRFGVPARYTVSGLFLFARICWLGVVIYGPALAMSVATGMPLWLAICMMGLLATGYTAMGGLSAVLWTDLIQFVILVVGAVWITVSLIGQIPGGAAEIVSVANEFGRFDVFDPPLNLYKLTALSAAMSWFFVFLNDYGVDQVTVQRLIAVRDFRGTAKAVVFNSLSDVLINGMLLFIGLGLFCWFQNHPGMLSEHARPDEILPTYILHSLPAGVSGLIITAIFAAAMSSMDSGINSLSTVIVCDFVRPLRSGNLSESSGVSLARWITVLLGLFATAAAFYVSRQQHIVQAWSIPVSLFGGPSLALFLLGMLTKKSTFYSWLIGAVPAICLTLYVQFTHNPNHAVHWVYYFPLSFSTAFVIGLIVSMVIPARQMDSSLTVWKRREI